MKYWMFILCFLPLSANATLYAYDMRGNIYDSTSSASSLIFGFVIIDADAQKITEFSFTSDLLSASADTLTFSSHPSFDEYCCIDGYSRGQITFNGNLSISGLPGVTDGVIEYSSDIFTPIGEDPIEHWHYDDGPNSQIWVNAPGVVAEFFFRPYMTNKRIIDTSAEVPEPTTLALLGLGLGLAGLVRRSARPLG